jgi:hypothetical protein
VPREIDK